MTAIREPLCLLSWQTLGEKYNTNTELEQHYQRVQELAEERLERANLCLYKGIQPEVWPTGEEDFRSAKTRIQYDPEKLHFAICGSSGSGKSFLINAFCGLKNVDPGATSTGVDETTISVTRYPDPINGAGTLNVPG